MSSDPFEVYANSDDVRAREVKDYSSRQRMGDEFRPEDADFQSMRLHVSSRRLTAFFYVFLIGLGVLAFRSSYLQIVHGASYRELAEGNRIRIQTLKPARGLVYDRLERSLVENEPNFTLQAVPADIPTDPAERANLIAQVAAIIEADPAPLAEALDKLDPDDAYSFEPITLADHIDINRAIKLKIQSHDLPGIVVAADTSRKYTAGNAFAHLLGYVGKLTETELSSIKESDLRYARDDIMGKTGLEKSYESVLRGTPGQTHVEVDSLGKVKKVVASDPPIPGQDVILSINLDYQQKLQELLETQVNDLRSPGGAAVAIDPRNGEILAIASAPSFDNNVFSRGISTEEYRSLSEDPRKPLFNRSISGEYPSGSTIKPMIAAAALAEGIVTPSTQIMSSGGIRIDQWFFPDWKAGGHGATNVIKAIAESVNTYFYAVGGGYEKTKGLGVEKIKEYGRSFGFGETLGIDIPNESTGFLPDKKWKEETKKEAWYIGDTYHLSIGQGDLLATPLQIASMTATVANGGTLYQPHVVKALRDPESKSITEQAKVVLNAQTVPRSAIDPVRQGMREGVVSGSSRSLADLSVPAAGKTGTAQFRADRTHAWFTGFAPYDNPEIAITVLIEDGGEGHAGALPVAKEFLKWYFGQTAQ